jgi:hypothetical protein
MTALPTEIVIVMDRDLPEETTKYLASVAADEVFVVDQNKSLAQVSQEHFRHVRHANILLSLRNPDLLKELEMSGKNADSPLAEGTSINIPEIEPSSRYAKIRVAPGSSIGDAALIVGTHIGPETSAVIGKLNPTLGSLDDVPAYKTVRIPVTTCVLRIRLKSGVDPNVAAKELAGRPGVHSVAPNYDGTLEDSIDESISLANLSELDSRRFAITIGADKTLPEDLQLNTRIIMAILDGGIDLSHPSFQKDLWANPNPNSYPYGNVRDDVHGYDFSGASGAPQDTLRNSHGTHVAGIASARFLGTFVPAFNPAALDDKLKLMILRVADNEGRLNLANVTKAIDYAAQNGAKLVAGSWNIEDNPYLRDFFNKYGQLLFVVAAGNGVDKTVDGKTVRIGINIDQTKVFPASYKLPNLISVAALSSDGKSIASFSNFGAGTIQLAAPGEAIESTVRHETEDRLYGVESGTSQAAPFVSLAAGLIWSKNSNLSVSAVRKRILYTADRDPNLMKAVSHGRLNVLKAISIDQDIVELDDHTMIRGAIRTQGIHFAEGSADCDHAIKNTVSDDALFRFSLTGDGARGFMFLGTHTSEGTVCDKSITISTKGGEIQLDLGRVRDVIWKGIPQFESAD